MSIEILTREDLHAFKNDLLMDIRKILTEHSSTSKKWLRTKEMLKLLQISPGTLQNYRINGTLKFSRVGTTIYYSLVDIEELLNKKISLKT